MGSNVVLIAGIILLVALFGFAMMVASTKSDGKVMQSHNALNLNLGEHDRVEVSAGRNGAINLTVIPVHVDDDGIPVPDLDEDEMTSSSGLNREFWEKVLNRDSLNVTEISKVNETLSRHGFSTGVYSVMPPFDGDEVFSSEDGDIRRGGVPEGTY